MSWPGLARLPTTLAGLALQAVGGRAEPGHDPKLTSVHSIHFVVDSIALFSGQRLTIPLPLPRCSATCRGQKRNWFMSIVAWLFDQKLSDWVQGLGSLAAAGAAVGIALRQERVTSHRDDAARALRRQVLAAAIAPVLKDMNTTARLRNGLLQTIGRARAWMNRRPGSRNC